MTVLGKMGGSMDREVGSSKSSSSWGKQMSLHDELLSHERLTANEEMRRKIQKQQSLPENDPGPKRHRSLKEGLISIHIRSLGDCVKRGLVIELEKLRRY